MRVLISNYSSSSKNILKAVLIRLKYQVEVVADGVAALASLRRSDAPELAVLDSSLPGLDGFEVCRRLRADDSGRGIFVLLLTSENDLTEAITALDAGADDFLRKPFSSIEMTARLRIAEKQISDHHRRMSGTAEVLAKTVAPVLSGNGFKKNSHHLFSGKHTPLNALPPFAALGNLLVKVFAEMGLGTATQVDGDEVNIVRDFSHFSVILLPEKDAWLDLVLDMDSRSAQALFGAVAGAEGSLEDLLDMAGETLNMVQGAIKTALQDAFLDVLTPVIPFKIPEEKKDVFPMVEGEYCQHVLSLPGMTLRVRLYPHVAAVVSKHLDDVAICDVAAESVKSPGSQNLTFLNKGTMMNNSHLQKLREMAGSGLIRMRLNTIVPPETSARIVRT